jgi:hypothetical protein
LSEQSEIHDMTFSEASDKRIKAAKQLGVSFNVFTDRKQALDDLLLGLERACRIYRRRG